jgi:hypothetical protein
MFSTFVGTCTDWWPCATCTAGPADSCCTVWASIGSGPKATLPVRRPSWCATIPPSSSTSGTAGPTQVPLRFSFLFIFLLRALSCFAWPRLVHVFSPSVVAKDSLAKLPVLGTFLKAFQLIFVSRYFYPPTCFVKLLSGPTPFVLAGIRPRHARIRRTRSSPGPRPTARRRASTRGRR